MTKINCNFVGEKNGNAKLTIEDVKHIKGLYAKGGHTYESIAAISNVSKAQVYRIIKGKSWASVEM
jgi:DNA invertase Pin-like site-specific DNA recombinase